MEGNAGERQSRHLFDLMQMSSRGILDQAIEDKVLYTALIAHRRHFINLKNVNYNMMELQHLLFIPPDELLDTFRKDYETMRAEMIYGNSPDFEELIAEIRKIKLRLASVSH